MISFDDVKASADGWAKNMTVITQTISKASDYVSDIEESYQYLLMCVGVAFIVSLISLIVIRYFAGVFVWSTILIFLISLFVLGYLAHKESTDLKDRAKAENFESEDNNDVYNADNLNIVSKGAFIMGGVAFLLFLFNLSTISLSISIIKTAALFVAENLFVVFLPIVMAIISIVYFLAWAMVLAYLWSVGTPKVRTGTPFVEYEWDDKNSLFVFVHIFSLLWNMAFLFYLMIFMIGCACSIWYFNYRTKNTKGGSQEKLNSSNYYPRPLLTSFYYAFRYHLGSIAFGAFILAVIWLV